MEFFVCLNIFFTAIGLLLTYVFLNSLVRIAKASESIAESLANIARRRDNE